MARRRKRADPRKKFFQNACKRKGLTPGTSAFRACTRHEAWFINPNVNASMRRSSDYNKSVCRDRGFVERGTRAQRRAFWDCMAPLTDRDVRMLEVQQREARERRARGPEPDDDLGRSKKRRR